MEVRSTAAWDGRVAFYVEGWKLLRPRFRRIRPLAGVFPTHRIAVDLLWASLQMFRSQVSNTVDLQRGYGARVG